MGGMLRNGDGQPGRADPACAHLRRLLAGVPTYRQRWRVYVRRSSHQDVHQGAVAQVLADYLWETGEVPETETGLPRRLKDRVNRALAGHFVAPATLRLFIEAFDMEPRDANELWALFMYADSADLTVVRPAGQPDADARRLSPAPVCETLSVHEAHRVGADGFPAEHRTLEVIRALEPMDRYVYQVEQHAAEVEVLRGGRGGPVRPADATGVYGVEVALTSPLAPGQTASLEYRTVFARAEAPPNVRRGALGRLVNLDMHLRFHPARVPARVWWARWEAPWSDEPVEREPVTLSGDLDVHRFLPSLRGIAGFAWEWPYG